MEKDVCFDGNLQEFMTQLNFEKSKWQPYTQRLFDNLVKALKNQNRDISDGVVLDVTLKMKSQEEFQYYTQYFTAREKNVRALKTIYDFQFENISLEREDDISRMFTRLLSSIFVWENEFNVSFAPYAASAILQKEGVEQ